MTVYLSLAAGVVFLTVLVGFIVPEGKMNKAVNFVMRLICIFILVQPILKIFDLNITDAQSAQMIDYDYICGVYSKNQSEQLEKLIYENLQIECECTVDFVYADGAFKENGVTVLTYFVDGQTKDKIYEYLKGLGYIDINVNEKTA